MIWSIFSCTYFLFVYLLWWRIFKFLSIFIFVSLFLNFEFLSIFGTQALYQIYVTCFLLVYNLYFHSLKTVLDEVQFIDFFSFIHHAVGVKLKNSFMQCCKNVLLCFPPEFCNFTSHIKSVIHLECIFAYRSHRSRFLSFLFFFHIDVHSFQDHRFGEKNILSPLFTFV